MYARSLAICVALAVLFAGGCAATSHQQDVTPQLTSNDARLQTYRIRNWSIQSDNTLIVEGVDRRRYQATFLGPCTGLRFATRLSFVTRGTNQLDRFSGIVLPDGTRCSFSSFQEIVTPATSAQEAEKEGK